MIKDQEWVCEDEQIEKQVNTLLDKIACMNVADCERLKLIVRHNMLAIYTNRPSLISTYALVWPNFMVPAHTPRSPHLQ